jgi:hypothetical protein
LRCRKVKSRPLRLLSRADIEDAMRLFTLFFPAPNHVALGYFLYAKPCFRSKHSLGRAANALLDAPLQHNFVVYLGGR